MLILTNSQKNLKIRILILQTYDPLVSALLLLARLVGGVERCQLVRLHPAKAMEILEKKVITTVDVMTTTCLPVNDVRAQEGVDVFGHELAILLSVLGPVGVVAHHLLAVTFVAAAAAVAIFCVRFE